MKKFTFKLLFGFALLLSPTIHAQSNDDCANAIVLNCGDILIGEVTDLATGGTNISCLGNIGNDLWYSYVGNGQSITVTATASIEQPQVEVYASSDGSCSGFTPGNCIASAGSGSALVAVNFVSIVDVTYYIHVGNWINGDPGVTFDLAITCADAPTPPANDDCSDAQFLSVNTDTSCAIVTPGTVTAATASAVNQTACDGAEDDDVWYAFFATESAHILSFSNFTGSTSFVSSSLWTGACNALTLVPGSCSTSSIRIIGGLTVGEIYYVRVYTATAAILQNTTFDICIGTPGPPPTNDLCSDAIPLNCGDVFISQSTDVATGGDASSCIGSIGDDLWYYFVGDGQITTLTASALIEDPQIEVYASSDGTCSGFTTGNCIVSAGTGAASVVVNFVSVLGTTYYIRVGNIVNGDPGVTFDLSISCAVPSTPPANDDCAGAAILTVNPNGNCTAVSSGTVAGATASAVSQTACTGTEDDDVWYSFVATESTHIISFSNVTGSTAAVSSSLWTGNCNSLTLVTGSCSAFNFRTVVGLTAGVTYYLRVYTATAAVLQDTTFEICIGTPPPPPSNDECTGATALNVNSDGSCALFQTGTIQSATASATNSLACAGTEDDDVWYSFVASDVIQTIRFNNVAGSSTALYSSLWSGNCSALTLVDGSCSAVNLSTVNGLTAGQTYYVRVYTATAVPGQNTTFDICIGTPPPPPANDDCTGAVELTIGASFEASPVTGSNISATNTVGLPFLTCVATTRSNDVWYSVVVPASGTLTVETRPAPSTVMTDSVLTIFSGVCGSLVEIGCDDNSSASGNFSLEVLTGLTPGDVIYIGVWRQGTTLDGEFQISAYDTLLSNSVFQSANFISYPNPVKAVLNLSYNKTISNVSVFNILGQEVMIKSINANQSQIDMSGLIAGTYLVKVTADNQVKSIKVIKE